MLDRLRQTFDEQERRWVEYPNTTREAVGYVVRHVSPLDRSGQITFAALSDETADAAIEDQIAYYTGIGHTFNWRFMDYDLPADLPARLEDYGFVTDVPDAVCVLEIAAAPPELLTPPPLDLRPITQAADLAVVEDIWQAVDRGELGPFREVLAHDLAAGVTTIHVAWVDGIAAAMGGCYYGTNDFANLWGGATLPDYRQRGLYRALLAVRLMEAQARGKKYLRVDCSPMSRPIVERLGFICIGMMWTYHYGETRDTPED